MKTHSTTKNTLNKSRINCEHPHKHLTQEHARELLDLLLWGFLRYKIHKKIFYQTKSAKWTLLPFQHLHWGEIHTLTNLRSFCERQVRRCLAQIGKLNLKTEYYWYNNCLTTSWYRSTKDTFITSGKRTSAMLTSKERSIRHSDKISQRAGGKFLLPKSWIIIKQRTSRR